MVYHQLPKFSFFISKSSFSGLIFYLLLLLTLGFILYYDPIHLEYFLYLRIFKPLLNIITKLPAITRFQKIPKMYLDFRFTHKYQRQK